jgi:hypothetical protein
MGIEVKNIDPDLLRDKTVYLETVDEPKEAFIAVVQEPQIKDPNSGEEVAILSSFQKMDSLLLERYDRATFRVPYKTLLYGGEWPISVLDISERIIDSALRGRTYVFPGLITEIEMQFAPSEVARAMVKSQ